jgi:hypothetical protein
VLNLFAAMNQTKGFWAFLLSLFIEEKKELPKFVVSYDRRLDNIDAGTMYRLLRPGRWAAI